MSPDPICYCPRCGEPLAAEFRDGKLVAARCNPGDMELSPHLVELVQRQFFEAIDEVSRIHKRIPWGGPWYCPRDGARISGPYGPLDCPTCTRQLDPLIFPLIEYHPHARAERSEPAPLRDPPRRLPTTAELHAWVHRKTRAQHTAEDARVKAAVVARPGSAAEGERVAWMLLGDCRSDGEPAAGLFAEVVRRDPSRSTAWLGLAECCHVGFRRWDPVFAIFAAGFCRRALLGSPDLPPALELIEQVGVDHPTIHVDQPFDGDLSHFLAMIGFSIQGLARWVQIPREARTRTELVEQMKRAAWPMFLPTLEALAANDPDGRVRAAATRALEQTRTTHRVR